MTEGTVFVVDDDRAVLKGLARLLRSAGFDACCFDSAESFLAAHDAARPGCAILDLALGGLSGVDLQQTLLDSGCERPIIFLTGRGDVPSSVRAMKSGAVDFLTKPVNDEDLLNAVRMALAKDQAGRAAQAERATIDGRLAALTKPEREVLQHVISGQLNKQIAARLGIAEKTIKVHRGRLMAKMRVRSLAELVRLAERAGVAPAERRPTP